jgi:hypothetical protein
MLRGGRDATRRLAAQEHFVHAFVVVFVCTCATILGGLHELSSESVSNVFMASIGYAAGRSGTTRSLTTRSDDLTTTITPSG